MDRPVFHATASDVYWNAGGPSVLVTPDMLGQLTTDLTQEGIDAASMGDIDSLRRSTRMLYELRDAMASARRWIEAARAA